MSRIDTDRILRLAESLRGAPVNPRDLAACEEIFQALPKLTEAYDWISRMKDDMSFETQDALRRSATWIKFSFAPEPK
jgi:hypothetical protein